MFKSRQKGNLNLIFKIWIGDGGFQMTIQELGTIMQSGINVKLLILNNSFLGMVRQWQELFYSKLLKRRHLKSKKASQEIFVL